MFRLFKWVLFSVFGFIAIFALWEVIGTVAHIGTTIWTVNQTVAELIDSYNIRNILSEVFQIELEERISTLITIIAFFITCTWITTRILKVRTVVKGKDQKI